MTTTTEPTETEAAQVSALAKRVIEQILANTADDALAEETVKTVQTFSPTGMYHFIVQLTGGLKATEDQKTALRAFNLLLNKCEGFQTIMKAMQEFKQQHAAT